MYHEPFDEPAASPSAPPNDDAASRSGVDPGPIEEALAAVDEALVRLDKGTYGECSVCREPLDDAVLEADPFAQLCAGHLPGTLAPRDIHQM